MIYDFFKKINKDFELQQKSIILTFLKIYEIRSKILRVTFVSQKTVSAMMLTEINNLHTHCVFISQLKQVLKSST